MKDEELKSDCGCDASVDGTDMRCMECGATDVCIIDPEDLEE